MRKIYFILIFIFISQEAYTQSNFTLLNPLPTGNDLTDIQFVDGVFYACGWYNALIKSTDNGETWHSISTGQNTATISKVYFINKDTGYFSGSGLFKTTNGGINWLLVNASAPVISMFVNEMVGFGESKKTTNGGVTWVSMNVPGAGSIRATYFISENTGFVSRNDDILYRTSNSGANWQSFNLGYFASAIHFLDSQIGFAGCAGGKIFKTTNSGINWNLISTLSNTSYYPYKIKFLSPLIGYELVLGNLYKTINGGSNWTQCSSEILESSFDIANDSSVVMVGSYGAIVKSTNTGNSWTQKQIDFLEGGSINSMDFINNQTGYFVGNKGVFFKTTNCGGNWSKIITNISNNFNCLDILNDSVIYIGADTGKIYKYNLSNGDWEIYNTNSIFNLSGIRFRNSNIGVVISSRDPTGGVAYPQSHVTFNGGINWTSSIIYGNTGWYLNAIEFVDSTKIFVNVERFGIQYHYGSVHYSSDFGINWVSLNLPFIYDVFDDIDFVGSIGYLSGHNFGLSGGIYKTTDYGQSWNQITNVFGKIDFLNNNVAFVNKTSYGGKTTNGGLNWEGFYIGTQYGGNSCFIDYNTGFVYGGQILARTTNGGGIITNVNLYQSETPTSFSLHQNYPNPFNPSTKIKFDIPEGSLVKLRVYDILGREVAELVNEKLNAGVYEYEWNGAGLTSGVYFYRLEAGEFNQSRRMVLVK